MLSASTPTVSQKGITVSRSISFSPSLFLIPSPPSFLSLSPLPFSHHFLSHSLSSSLTISPSVPPSHSSFLSSFLPSFLFPFSFLTYPFLFQHFPLFKVKYTSHFFLSFSQNFLGKSKITPNPNMPSFASFPLYCLSPSLPFSTSSFIFIFTLPLFTFIPTFNLPFRFN